MIQMHHGDCLDVMPRLPAASVDMVLADLPYGTTQNAWDSVIPLDTLWREYRRLTKPDAAIVLTAAQPFTTTLIASNRAEFKYDLVWRKNKATGFLNAKKQPLRNHESILVFYRRQPFYAPQMTRDHKPGNYAKRVKASTNYGAQTPTEYGGSTERYPLSVQDFPIINNDSDAKVHPTQKPTALMEWLIRSYTRPGALVLDNTMGSGTTGEACLNTGRRFIGIESDPTYFAHAERRVALPEFCA